MDKYLYADVEGLENMKANLDRLMRATVQVNLRKVAQAGAQPVLQDMQDRVPRDTGALARDLAIRPQRTANLYEGLVYVGPSLKTSWRAKFIERGTGAHTVDVRRTRTGRRRRKPKKGLYDAKTKTWFGTKVEHPGIRPNAFMKNAIERQRPEVYAIMQAELLKFIHGSISRV